MKLFIRLMMLPLVISAKSVFARNNTYRLLIPANKGSNPHEEPQMVGRKITKLEPVKTNQIMNSTGIPGIVAGKEIHWFIEISNQNKNIWFSGYRKIVFNVTKRLNV